MAMPKPTIVTQKVRHAWPRMIQRNSIVCSTMRHGLGKMNSLTSNTRADQLPQHQHDGQQHQRRPAFACVRFMAPPPPDRLAHRADVPAQLVHDLG